MELAEYIDDLLHKHNCVIVPNFGGFIANYKSAIIDASKKRVSPPFKSILFNGNLVNNDGLLGNKIAQNKSISYADANHFITEKVSNWKADLSAGKRIEIGEIGFLFNQNGQIIFEQNREVNILLNAYGLSSVSFVNFTDKKETEQPIIAIVNPKSKAIPIVQTTTVKKEVFVKEPQIITLNTAETIEKEVEIEAVQEQPVIAENIIPISHNKRKGLKYLAAAAVIPLLFYSYWIPVETDFIDTGNIQMADFNPIHKAPDRIYKMGINSFEPNELAEVTSWNDLTNDLSENVEVYNYQFDDELYIPIKLDKTATDLPTEEANLSAPNDTSSSELKYHIISGCFSVKSNADNLVLDLIKQGYSAKVLDLNKGLYRVTAGDYSSRSEANSNLKSFKSGGLSGWILKK